MKYPALEGVSFVGDLSLEDASVLADEARQRLNVIEFGSGGSTQIFAQCSAGSVFSIETESEWIEKTSKNLEVLGLKNKVIFASYGFYPGSGNYDLVFVDGAPNLRLEFATHAWKRLNVGGVMIFHDTRRFEYFREAAWIMQLHFNEIDKVEINHKGSNLTLIYKGEPKNYVNWNETEGKPAWAYGKADRPEGGGLWQIEN
jgi:precorrin-6B methylase 2